MEFQFFADLKKMPQHSSQLAADTDLFIKEIKTKDPKFSMLLSGIDRTLEEIKTEIYKKNTSLTEDSCAIQIRDRTLPQL